MKTIYVFLLLDAMRNRGDTAQYFDDIPFGYAQLQSPEETAGNGPEQWDVNYHEAYIFLEVTKPFLLNSCVSICK